MKDKIVTIIAFELSVVLLTSIAWCFNAVMTDSYGEQDIMADRAQEWITEGFEEETVTELMNRDYGGNNNRESNRSGYRRIEGRG